MLSSARWRQALAALLAVAAAAAQVTSLGTEHEQTGVGSTRLRDFSSDISIRMQISPTAAAVAAEGDPASQASAFDLNDRVDWKLGDGLPEVSKKCRGKLSASFLPSFALADNYTAFLQARQADDAVLERMIATISSEIRSGSLSPHLCARYALNPVFGIFLDAFGRYAESVGIKWTVHRKGPSPEEMAMCDIYIKKAMRESWIVAMRKAHRFPRFIFWELPLFWREDPVDPNRTWAFITWDYLNGYGMPLQPMPSDRWNHHFARHMPVRPWIGPRPNGYALLIGQMPSDTAVIGALHRYKADIFTIYRNIVHSIRAELPWLEIVYRPHPDLHDRTNFCLEMDEGVPGVTERTAEDETLEEALAGAAVAVSVTSSATVESVIRGIPTITLDYESPTYPVTCHSFGMLKDIVVEGTACRPPREQWLYNLAYVIWSTEDVENGDLFRHLFRTGIPQRLYGKEEEKKAVR